MISGKDRRLIEAGVNEVGAILIRFEPRIAVGILLTALVRACVYVSITRKGAHTAFDDLVAPYLTHRTIDEAWTWEQARRGDVDSA
jgi:hypothetical protein